MLRLAVMLVFVGRLGSVSHLSQVEEEAGVLPGLRQVRQEHGDTDQQDRGVLTHLPQRLEERERQTEKGTERGRKYNTGAVR